MDLQNVAIGFYTVKRQFATLIFKVVTCNIGWLHAYFVALNHCDYTNFHNPLLFSDFSTKSLYLRLLQGNFHY